jgi:major type 1 subunit fimbrin (pilin)
MKKLILSAALIAGVGAIASPSAMAADGTITFNGEIAADTCSVHGGDAGSNNFDVNLPQVLASDFAGGVGSVAGTTNYAITVGAPGEDGCTDGTPVSVHYEPNSAQVDPVSGNLNIVDVPGQSAAGLQLQVLNGDMSVINLATQMDSTPVEVVGNTAVLPFYVQYVSTAANVTAGGVRSSVLYSIKYN